MKILIINPPAVNTVKEYPDEHGEGFLEAADYGLFPPLGPLYVLSYVEKRYPEHQYFFLDCVGESLSYTQIRERLSVIVPDIVGVTSFTPSLIDVIHTAQAVRAVTPAAHICLGGHHPIAFPYESCQLPQFDSVIIGEGEYAFAELVHAFAESRDFRQVPGVYTHGSIETGVLSPPTKGAASKRSAQFLCCIEDLDSLPIPNRKHIAHIAYKSIIGQKGNLATIITSRGCPYQCSFCDVPFKRYRSRSQDAVMDEIESCLHLGYSEFHFYDDLFNITPKKVYEFLEALASRNLKITWDFRGRVNGITRELLAACKTSGLRMITFGVETGTDEGLRTLRKDTSIQQIDLVFRWCRELGIMTVADFMIGLPNEKTISDVRDNIDFLIALNPDYAQINILNLYPNTEIYEEAVANGLIEAGRWNEFARNPNPDFHVEHWTEWLTERELISLHREAYRKFYFRLSYILKRIFALRTFHEFKSGIQGVLRLLRAFLVR